LPDLVWLSVLRDGLPLPDVCEVAVQGLSFSGAACGCAHAASGHAAAPPIRPKNLASSHMTSLKEDQLRWWTF